MFDWSTFSSVATAAGTLVLAVATFSSVRSANRSARVAERALMAGLRPVLAPSRMDDPVQKIGFVDGKWLLAQGGGAAVETTDEAVYLGIAVRNVGSGIAVLHGWYFHTERSMAGVPHPEPSAFRTLTRDLLVPAGDVGFWQGAFRDSSESVFSAARAMIAEPHPFAVDVLYGDHEGGQRTVTRFWVQPYNDRWLATVARHWNLDRSDPR